MTSKMSRMKPIGTRTWNRSLIEFTKTTREPDHRYGWERDLAWIVTPKPGPEVADKLDWPRNLWMGVSVESADVTDRIDQLRHTSARTKFLSCEPLLPALPDLTSPTSTG